ncbi:hypothetical protein [Synechococcus sp. BS55D]|uniref:hypothetical protein n=1 Tax=Synechococcus sp. BS55D TaxID=2055943 RepID=UPI0010386A1B|nr:hypothetical protein [Synechococcus sp. BS55D]TCD57993.1 hypothetical protein CWE16_01370 [Synechococcus sp. BS55D]
MDRPLPVQQVRLWFERSARWLVLFGSTASFLRAFWAVFFVWPARLQVTVSFVSRTGQWDRLLMEGASFLVFVPLTVFLELYLVLLMLREINQAPSIWHWRSFRRRWPMLPIGLAVALQIVEGFKGVFFPFM